MARGADEAVVGSDPNEGLIDFNDHRTSRHLLDEVERRIKLEDLASWAR